jgi:hypothetical protein
MERHTGSKDETLSRDEMKAIKGGIKPVEKLMVDVPKEKLMEEASLLPKEKL